MRRPTSIVTCGRSAIVWASVGARRHNGSSPTQRLERVATAGAIMTALVAGAILGWLSLAREPGDGAGLSYSPLTTAPAVRRVPRLVTQGDSVAYVAEVNGVLQSGSETPSPHRPPHRSPTPPTTAGTVLVAGRKAHLLRVASPGARGHLVRSGGRRQAAGRRAQCRSGRDFTRRSYARVLSR